MRSAVVHIGMPKTGSTSLQQFFRDNTARLAARGVHFPQRRVYPDGHAELGVIALAAAGQLLHDAADRHHLGIADLASQERAAAEFARQIEADLPAEGTVLFSSESLGHWLRGSESRAALDAWLSRRFDHVGYLIYLRPMAGFTLSNYAEAVRRELDESLDRFIAIGNFPGVAATLVAWRDQFGPRLRARMLPGRDAPRDQLYRDALAAFGLDLDPEFEIPRAANVSPSAYELQVMRWFTRRFGPNYLRSPRQRQLLGWACWWTRRLPGGKRKLRLTESQAALTALRFPRDPAPLVQAMRDLEDPGPWPRGSGLSPAAPERGALCAG